MTGLLLHNRRVQTGAWALGAALAALALIWGLWPRPHLVYTRSGYGGYMAAAGSAGTLPAPRGDRGPAQPALEAYNAGRYSEAEQLAQGVAARGASATDPQAKAEGLRAQWVLAFAAARRRQLPLARERFAELRRQAAALPDPQRKVRLEASVPLGENPPTLGEEGAYQHAVLTAALGDPKAAEAEYVAFMRTYPESPLVHAAVRRIARLHGGDVPPAAEAVWKAAVATAQARERERASRAARCGPACLAELLARRGADGGRRPTADGRRATETALPSAVCRLPSAVEELAREMGTSDQGTSLAALAAAARKRGLAARGLQLTQKGLARQKLPLIALVQPGHYVLVERVDGGAVRVWDPDGASPGQPATKEYKPEAWAKAWNGLCLVF